MQQRVAAAIWLQAGTPKHAHHAPHAHPATHLPHGLLRVDGVARQVLTNAPDSPVLRHDKRHALQRHHKDGQRSQALTRRRVAGPARGAAERAASGQGRWKAQASTGKQSGYLHRHRNRAVQGWVSPVCSAAFPAVKAHSLHHAGDATEAIQLVAGGHKAAQCGSDLGHQAGHAVGLQRVIACAVA